MRKTLVVLAVVAVVGVSVWYAPTRLPLKELDDRAVDTSGAVRKAITAIRTAPTARGTSPGANLRATLAPDSQVWPTCSTGCGKERWLVKTLADPAHDRVDLAHVVDATVAQLASLNTATTTVVGGWRNAPIETTVYRVKALLVGVLDENDHDFHLVLADPDDTQVTMIAEIPDPNCEAACVSGFASRYVLARQLVDQHFSRHPVTVRVTGVGFIDFDHGQIGAAPNEVELHPVLAIEFPSGGARSSGQSP